MSHITSPDVRRSPCRKARRPPYRPRIEELETRTVLNAGPFASPTFQARFTELLRTYNVPQASLAVQFGNQTYTYGETNTQFYAGQPLPDPVTADSLFRIGSISKVFAAAAIMTMVQDGRVQLTDSAFEVLGYQRGQTVSGFDPMSPQNMLPALPIPDALFDVTLEQLLWMTSNLPQSVPVESVSFPPPPGKAHLEAGVLYTPGSYAALAFAGTPVGTAPDYLPASVDQQLAYYVYQVSANPHLIGPAGQEYEYSDTGYAVLGAIVERLAEPLGLDYGDYLQTYVLGPMGISPPSAQPVPNPAMVGVARTKEDQAYPTEVIYHDRGSGPSVFPDPANAANPPYYPAQHVPQPYGAWAYIESHFGEGGLTATPTALVRFYSNLGAVYNGTGTGPLTQQTVAQMVAEPPLGADLPGGFGWWGLGWQVNPPAPGRKGFWAKNGAVPGTSAQLYRFDDGVSWAATFNTDAFADGSGSTAPPTDVPFSAELKQVINDAIYGAWSVTATSGTPQNAVVGRQFATPLQVTVRDFFGFPVVNAPVTFSAPSGASGTFTGSVVVMTNAQGVATAPVFTANGLSGTYAVTATVPGAETSATFVLTNTPALFVTAPGPGALPLVKIYDAQTQTLRGSFLAYRRSQRRGVRVAVGDVNGDGFLDIITAPGTGAAAHVRVFDGRTGQLLTSFLAYPRGFSGGAFIAVGDVDGRPGDEIITGPARGPGAVKVFRAGGELTLSFFPFGSGFIGGVTVGAGNVRGGPAAEILAARATGPAFVGVFDGTGAELLRFRAFESGGVYVASGDLNGDGRAEIITGSAVGLPSPVRVFDGTTGGLLRAFQPPGATRGVGLRVGASETGTGRANLVTGNGAGAGPRAEVFNGLTLGLLRRFWADDPLFLGGIFVGGG